MTTRIEKRIEDTRLSPMGTQVKEIIETMGYPDTVSRDDITSLVLYGEPRKLSRREPMITEARWNVSVILPTIGYHRIKGNKKNPLFRKGVTT